MTMNVLLIDWRGFAIWLACFASNISIELFFPFGDFFLGPYCDVGLVKFASGNVVLKQLYFMLCWFAIANSLYLYVPACAI